MRLAASRLSRTLAPQILSCLFWRWKKVMGIWNWKSCVNIVVVSPLVLQWGTALLAGAVKQVQAEIAGFR